MKGRIADCLNMLDLEDRNLPVVESALADAWKELAALSSALHVAREALADVALHVQDWCDAIDRNGTSWDDWDHHYKHFAYRGGLGGAHSALSAIDAALAGTGESHD